MIADREREPKRASFPKFALNADFSLVRFHRESAKGEAEAGGMSMLAAAVCLSELFEDVFVLIRRDPPGRRRSRRSSRPLRCAEHLPEWFHLIL